MKSFGFSLVTLSSLFMVSCNMSDHHKNDPYGIIEAEEIGGQSERLIKCSQDENCPQHAQALFWVAADILSEASAETVDIEGKDFGLTDDMTVEEMTEKLGPQLEELIDSGPPNYDFQDDNFKRGLDMMHQAHQAGSVYASNELGVLFMEQSHIQDLKAAQTYFNAAFANGDFASAYNLARIAHMEGDDKQTLTLLKAAADGNEEDFKVMYLLGMEAFGTQKERQSAAQELSKRGAEISYLRDDFCTHFVC